MKKYKQLNLELRYKKEILLEDYKKSEIADKIGVDKSTITRELQRNVNKRGKHAGKYCAKRAHKKAISREKSKRKHIRFTYQMKEYMRKKLRKERWSPEIISEKGKVKYGYFVSAELMYQYIWNAKKSNHSKYKEDKDLHKFLRHIKRSQKRVNQRKRRGAIPNRIPISERPKEAEDRSRIGDLEVDLMMGANHKAGLIVITDRATLEVDMIKLETKKAEEVKKKIIRRLTRRSKNLKTLTFDNGLEFAKHEQIAKALNVNTYFTRPYTSQDKGSVENKIGIIRRFIPKKTDISLVTKREIKEIERKLNNRPVRKFGYLTPKEKKFQLSKVALAS
jgi:IS30 family transposase